MRCDLTLISIFLDRVGVSCMSDSCTYINGRALAGNNMYNSHCTLECPQRARDERRHNLSLSCYPHREGMAYKSCLKIDSSLLHIHTGISVCIKPVRHLNRSAEAPDNRASPRWRAVNTSHLVRAVLRARPQTRARNLLTSFVKKTFCLHAGLGIISMVHDHCFARKP